MTKEQPEKTIDPNRLYTPNSLADIFQVDERWVKDNLIYNRTCRHKKQGCVYMLLGKWVIEWAEADHEYPDEE